MTVLRELVTRLGFEVDKAGFDRASGAATRLKETLGAGNSGLRDSRGRFVSAGRAAADAAGRFKDASGRMREANGRFVGSGKSAQGAANALKLAGLNLDGLGASFGRLFAGGALALFGKKLVTMASDANETDNVLKEVFGVDGQKRVQQWAETTSQAMGRSKYRMKEMAGGLGAMLEPMVGSGEQAEVMSKRMSELAVDLGSFFNRTDDDALVALRAGLAGETEPLRRFGIVMLDATLQEYAHAQGISKKVAKMTVAEKTQLRYNFILEHSKKAQGDAARTSDGYANSSKGLMDALRDLGTDAGRTVIPMLQRVIKFGRDSLTKFNDLRQGTYALDASMGVLGATLAVMGLRLAAPFAIPIAVIAALILLVDELHALFTGGKSVIGEWLDEWGGVGTADALVRNLTESWQSFNDTLAAMPDIEGAFDLVTGAIDDVGFALEALTQKFLDFAENPFVSAAMFSADALGISDSPALKELAGGGEGWRSKKGTLYKSGLLGLLGIDPQQKDAEGRALEQGTNSEVANTFREQLRARRNDRNDFVRNGVAQRRAARESKRIQAKLAAEDALQSQDPNESEALGMSIASDPNAVQFGRARVAPPRLAAPASTSSQVATTNITVNNGPINMSVQPGAGAAETARQARQVHDAERRRTAEALKRSGG